MKKAICLLLIALMLCASCTVFAEGERVPADKYAFTTEDGAVMDTVFDGDVTVTGGAGRLIFVNCVFNGKVTLVGGEGAGVMFYLGCEFGEGASCAIESSVTEANVSTNLPKFMFFCPPVDVTCGNAFAVMALAEYDVIMNGKTYPISDCTALVDENGGYIGPFDGEGATLHNCCFWLENGIPVSAHLAVQADM